MEEAEHNLRIEKIAEMILSDNISLDEQEQNKLKNIIILQSKIMDLIKMRHLN